MHDVYVIVHFQTEVENIAYKVQSILFITIFYTFKISFCV